MVAAEGVPQRIVVKEDRPLGTRCSRHTNPDHLYPTNIDNLNIVGLEKVGADLAPIIEAIPEVSHHLLGLRHPVHVQLGFHFSNAEVDRAAVRVGEGAVRLPETPGQPTLGRLELQVCAFKKRGVIEQGELLRGCVSHDRSLELTYTRGKGLRPSSDGPANIDPTAAHSHPAPSGS